MERHGPPTSPAAPPDDLERLWRFLLDEMSEEEKIAIEDELLVDDVGLAVLESAEDELIDAYARNELSADRRQRFEKRFLATASQRARVALADALSTLASNAARTQDAAAPTPLRARTSSSQPRRRWRPLLFQMAAAAVIVGSLGMAGLRLIGSRRIDTIDVTLSPGSVRGAAEIPAVHVPARRSQVRLRLNLSERPGDNVTAVEILLRHETDEPRQLSASRAPGDEGLLVAVDSRALPAGTYELTARISDRGAAPRDLAVYLFRVEIP
jgi:hypothetical protein